MRIGKPEVDALPGKRVHGVCGVTDKREAGPHICAAMLRDSAKAAGAPSSVMAPSTSAPAPATRRASAAGAMASSSFACAAGVDHTMEMRRPGSGSHASTPLSLNHWRAIPSCPSAQSKLATTPSWS